MATGGKGGQHALSTLYVGDLLLEVSEAHLDEKFAAIGPIAMIHVCRDSCTNASLGYAYVNYYSQIDAQQALDTLNYSDILGRCCRIMWSKRERPFQASPEANIFIKNLDLSIDSKALYDTFSIFGHILSCKVASSPDGTSRGYGFVQYESEDAAKQAIERVNGMLIGEKKVFVGPFTKRDRSDEDAVREGRSVHVRNIPDEWDDAQVLELFVPLGEVLSSLIMSDVKNNKRYGFVNFKDVDTANTAVKMLHGKDLRTEDEKRAMEDQEEVGEENDGEEATNTALGKPPNGSKRVPGHCLMVSHAKSRIERQREAQQERFEGIRLYVRNLPPEIQDDDLRALFEKFGAITDLKAVQDRDTGVCKGYGFVRFATMEEATAAVEHLHLRHAIPGALPLQVGLAGPKGSERGPKGADAKGRFGAGKGVGKAGAFKGGKDISGKGGGQNLNPTWGIDPQRHPPMGMYPSQLQNADRPPWPPGPYPQAPPWSAVPSMAALGGGMLGGMPYQPSAYMPRPGMPLQACYPQAPAMAQQMQPMPHQQVASLSNAPALQKQKLGERLFPIVARMEAKLGGERNAGKITGMLLEMDEMEIMRLLDSEETLRQKVAEAIRILTRTLGTAADE